MKVNLLICLLTAAFVALASNAEEAPKEVPESIGFEGRTYAIEDASVSDDKYRLLFLYSPNLPYYDDERYHDHPDSAKIGKEVKDIRIGVYSRATGEVAVLKSINGQLNKIAPSTFPLDENGNLTYHASRRATVFGFRSWNFAEHKGVGLLNHKLATDRFLVNIVQKDDQFFFHTIPQVTVDTLRRIWEEIDANANFGVNQPLKEEDRATRERNLSNVFEDESDWELFENLNKIDDHLYYFKFTKLGARVPIYIIYEFGDDGSVTLKNVLFFPYPTKAQCLKLYINATNDVDGASALEKNPEFTSAQSALWLYPEDAHDLGDGKFAVYGVSQNSFSDVDQVPLLLFYQVDTQGQLVMEKVIKANPAQSEAADDHKLTNELIQSTPATPLVKFQ